MSQLAIYGGNSVGSLDLPSWPIYSDSELLALQRVLHSGAWGQLGENERKFEESFAQFCGVEHAILVSNGSVSLRLALEALEVGPGDEVIVPGFTWQATASAVLDVNAVPILVDIDPETYCISTEQIKAAISPRTKCIIPVHLYCRVANMDEIMHIAREHGLYVLEDCAHQHGSEWRGAKVGAIGDIGSFSLQSSKILNSGEGGILTTNSTVVAERLHSLKNCGKPIGKGASHMQSGNYRLTEFQSTILNCQLERLASQNEVRERNALYLERCIAGMSGLKPLSRSEGISFQAYYAWVLRYDACEWENLPRKMFELCLQAELGYSLPREKVLNQPLNDSQLYQPRSKRTHFLSQEYWEAIDPKRFSLPCAWKAFNQEAIPFYHTLLLGSRHDCDIFVEALYKLQNHKEELSTRVKRG